MRMATKARMAARSGEPWRLHQEGRGTGRGEGARGGLRAQRKDASGDVIAIDALQATSRPPTGYEKLPDIGGHAL